MNRLFHGHVRTLIALLLIAAAAYIAEVPFPSPRDVPEISGFYRVMQVYDGDTISILQDGKRITVRLIGIDSPEINTPYTKSACFGAEASAAAKQLMSGTMVRIETDPTQAMYDQYERLLAYVYVPTDALPGGVMANEYLVREGFAREYTFKTAYAHQTEFKAAQSAAQSEKKGLWSACVPAPHAQAWQTRTSS